MRNRKYCLLFILLFQASFINSRNIPSNDQKDSAENNSRFNLGMAIGIQSPYNREGTESYKMGYGGAIKANWRFFKMLDLGVSCGAYIFSSHELPNGGSTFSRVALACNPLLMNVGILPFKNKKVRPVLLMNGGWVPSNTYASWQFECGIGAEIKNKDDMFTQINILFGEFSPGETITSNYYYGGSNHHEYMQDVIISYIHINIGVRFQFPPRKKSNNDAKQAFSKR